MSGFAAIILAGDRGGNDPLVVGQSSHSKALVHIDGIPMIQRVLDALGAAACIDSLYLSGPLKESLASQADLRARIDSGSVLWRAPQETPSTSAYSVLLEIPDIKPVLLTTADLPLLQARFIEHFCAQALTSGADVVVGLAPYTLVRESFPDMKKTVLRFSDGAYCGCNLFAFMTPAGRTMADRWRAVENQRKSPLKVIRLLGWGAVLRYRLGLLSLDSALALLSRKMGLRLAAVRMPFAEAAVDVDSLDDHRQVESRLQSARRLA